MINLLSVDYAYQKLTELGKDAEYEKTISNSYVYSYKYASIILNAPFPLGEPAIAKDSLYSFLYAKNILKGRFKLGEKKLYYQYFTRKGNPFHDYTKSIIGFNHE